MSTDNLFYRYRIVDVTDLKSSTFSRRYAKLMDSNRKSFFFDLSCHKIELEDILHFLKNYTKPTDAVLLPINTILADSSNCLSDYTEQLIGCINNYTDLYQIENLDRKITNYLLIPSTTIDLKKCIVYLQKKNKNTLKTNFFWEFQPYTSSIRKSITCSDIFSQNFSFNKIQGLEIYNPAISPYYELIPTDAESYKVCFKFSTAKKNVQLSVIIPTYNSCEFLSQVIRQLTIQSTSPDLYEIIIVDDGGNDKSPELIKNIYSAFSEKINLTYIYWQKNHPTRGRQDIFRAGLARNLGAKFASGNKLFFLDSDMLVPEDFVAITLEELKNADIIQFQRFHIHQIISKNVPNYSQINKHLDTYIEESQYWSQLFDSSNWMSLPNYWKYTCTYALGISKTQFIKLGMFKKYYISYGFEDTDLGYEAYKKNAKFKLVKKPLFHLTAYNLMQYKNSNTQRYKLLRKTAALFYLQHLDKEIFLVLGNFLRFQKDIRSFIRDIFS